MRKKPPFLGVILEECLNEIDEETKKVKRLLQQKEGVRQLLKDLWQEESLVQKFTLKHLVLLECCSDFDLTTIEKLESLATFQLLDRYSLATFISKLPKPHGGRRRSLHIIDLALKLALCASYQWLLDRETERERVLHPTEDRRKARSRAHNSLKSAHRLSRRMLRALRVLVPDIDERHFAVTRTLWEDKYKPFVLLHEGLISDICY